jgi:pteridine reductase
MNLKHCTALVTGGAVRIGRAICEELAAQGCSIVIHFNHSAPQAESLRQELLERGVQAWLVRGPLDTPADCERVMDDAWTGSGGLDILVNNSAIFSKQRLLEATGEDFERLWRVNALAPILLTRAFALRCGNKPGAVIHLLDKRIAGNETGCMPYLLSKKMLADFTRNAALELAPAIRVNAVAPGAILPPPRSHRSIRDLAGPVPLECQCTPADVAKAVVFLAGSDTITGQILFVDGGQHLCA